MSARVKRDAAYRGKSGHAKNQVYIAAMKSTSKKEGSGQLIFYIVFKDHHQ